jgi:hypothetical protein
VLVRHADGVATLRQLPPGFRFKPTDEELVVQYLRRKAFGVPLPAAVIPVVRDLYGLNPWDIPGQHLQNHLRVLKCVDGPPIWAGKRTGANKVAILSSAYGSQAQVMGRSTSSRSGRQQPPRKARAGGGSRRGRRGRWSCPGRAAGASSSASRGRWRSSRPGGGRRGRSRRA